MKDLLAETKLFRVGLYFSALVVSLLFILWKAIEVSRSAERVCRKLFLLPIFALCSLAITWREIIMFIIDLSKTYPDLKTTLKQEEVVVEVGMFVFKN